MHTRWREIVERAQESGLSSIAAARALEVLPQKPMLIGSSSKTEKGEAVGVETGVQYLVPAGGAMKRGHTNCPLEKQAGCGRICLGSFSGRMILRSVRDSQVWKTALYWGDRDLWTHLALRDAERLAKRARRAGYIPAVRFDGSSDHGAGERLLPDLRSMGVEVYDYTKDVDRALRCAGSDYHVVYSYYGTERSRDEARRVLLGGGSVSVVYGVRKGQALPAHWVDAHGEEWPVIDGDATGDARFYDREVGGAPASGGFVVGLRFKSARDWAGSAKRAGLFVTWPS